MTSHINNMLYAQYDYQSNVYNLHTSVQRSGAYIDNVLYDFVMFYVCSSRPPTCSILPPRLRRHAQCAEQIFLSYFGNVRDCEFQKVYRFDSLLSVAVGELLFFSPNLLGGG